MLELEKLFIVIGLIFDFYAVVSLLRMPDIYTRLQSSAKNVILGTCSIMFGVFLHYWGTGASFKVLLVICFFLLTAPSAVHALTKGAHKYGAKLMPDSVCDSYKEDNRK